MECLSSVYRQCGNVRYMYLKARKPSVYCSCRRCDPSFFIFKFQGSGRGLPRTLDMVVHKRLHCTLLLPNPRVVSSETATSPTVPLRAYPELPSTSDVLMTRPRERSTSEHNHDHWALTRTAASQQDSAIRQSSPWRERSRATSSSSHERRSRATCSHNRPQISTRTRAAQQPELFPLTSCSRGRSVNTHTPIVVTAQRSTHPNIIP